MPDSITRRTFVSSSAVAAPALLSAQSSGSKVNVGWVGLGNRGGKHIRTLMKVSKDDARVKAICDTFSPRLAKTKDDVITDQGSAPDTYDDYYKMLEDKSIDAVFIMTPEHLHHEMALAALDAASTFIAKSPWRTPSKRASISSTPSRRPARNSRSARSAAAPASMPRRAKSTSPACWATLFTPKPSGTATAR